MGRLAVLPPEGGVPALASRGLKVILACLVTLVLAPGCRAPVGADQASVSRVYRQFRHSALDGGACSDSTLAILHRYGGEQAFRKDPAKALRELHGHLFADERGDLLLALAELNYFQGGRLRRSVKPAERRGARDYFLASAIYAYSCLLAEAAEPQPRWLKPRLQLVRDLYNRALAQALLAPEATNALVRLEAGSRQLPVGPVEVRLNTNSFPWPLDLVSEFVMADAYAVKGLSVRNRQEGFGAPLIATALSRAENWAAARLPVTVFLRVESNLKDWAAGRLGVSLEVYPGDADSQVQVAGRSVPLEIDATAPLAYALNNPTVWRVGRKQFFSSHEIIRSGVYRLQPYRPGAVPVVFVHGTFSSPAAWAEMWNTLGSDPVLSRRCQCWAYIYNSGNPVLWSAANLRQALTDTVRRLDPEGVDPALRQMVVIGHSQGGLLAKLTVTRTGDKLWRSVSDENLEELQVSEDLRAQLRRALMVEPVPEVKRVIFVSTPHRGSFLAGSLARRLASRFVSLPGDIVRFAGEQANLVSSERVPASLRKRVPTSLDSMSPQNPIVLALAEMPPAAGVASHSIIGVKGGRPLEKDDDGVVAYQSAHVDYADSELVLRASHSCQREPAVIEEVRQILLKHLRATDAPDGTCKPPSLQPVK